MKRRSEAETEPLGLLPHEQFFVSYSHEKQRVIAKIAGESIGDALLNKSSGDWGGDDAGIHAAQADHHIQVLRLVQLEKLNGLPTIPYPNPESEEITHGSIFDLLDDFGNSRFTITTRPFIQGMPHLPEVEYVSPLSPLGKAVMGRKVGELVSWALADRNVTLSGTITNVDQVSLAEEYQKIIARFLEDDQAK